MRDVFAISKDIGQQKRRRDFLISPAVLSLIETRGLVPSIYRLHTLKLAYKLPLAGSCQYLASDLITFVKEST